MAKDSSTGRSNISYLKVKNKRSDTSRQLLNPLDQNPVTEKSVSQDSTRVIEPRYSPDGIRTIKEKSNILQQCITSYITNIAMYGFRIIPIQPGVEINQTEYDLLSSFLQQANTEESLSAVHAKRVGDYESYGFSFLEIIKNGRGQITLIKHIPSYGMRIMYRQGKDIEIKRTVVRGGSRSVVREYKRFRKYAQEINGRKIYFKELGDPRKMDYTNGRYETNEYKVSRDREATEVVHHKQYSEDAYGVPRWISQLPSILGSREAEEVNLNYFEDNMVPPIILSVAGGALSRGSYAELKQLLEEGGIGKDRQNKILLIEAVPRVTNIDDKSTNVTLQVDKLTDQRPSDSLFSAYDDANIAKVRSSFRLPPVVIGLSQDVNFATANVSAFVAETQVFLPERKIHDEFLNKKIINSALGLNLQTVKLESKGPSITNPEQVIKSMTALNVMGGITPRTAIQTINETMELSIPEYPEEGEEGYKYWMDAPMALALRGAKNTDLEQSVKDNGIKTVEGQGDIQMRQPEHGEE